MSEPSPQPEQIRWSEIPIGPKAVVARYLIRTPRAWTWHGCKITFDAWVCRMVGHAWRDDPDGAGKHCDRCYRWEEE